MVSDSLYLFYLSFSVMLIPAHWHPDQNQLLANLSIDLVVCKSVFIKNSILKAVYELKASV